MIDAVRVPQTPRLARCFRHLFAEACARRGDGLTDDDVKAILDDLGEPDPEAVLRMALADGVLIATWRCHGTDESHKDGWRYFELRRRA